MFNINRYFPIYWTSRIPGLRAASVPAIAFLATVAAFFPAAVRGIDPHHDGIMLKPALDVLAGQTLFKDTFTMYGPLSTYLQVGFLWALGKSLLSLKIGTVLLYGVAAAFLVASWRMILPTSLVVLCMLAWLALPDFYSTELDHVFLCWSSVYSLAFQSMSLYFLLRALRRRSVVDASLCGVAAALVAWCRPPVGVFHTAAVLSCLVIAIVARPREGRKAAAAALAGFVGGAAFASAAFLAHFWRWGSLADWYYQNFALPRLWADMVDSGVRSGSVAGKVFVSIVGLRDIEPPGWLTIPGLPRRAPTLALLLALLALPFLRRSASPCATVEGRRPLAWTFLPLGVYALLALWVLGAPSSNDASAVLAWQLAVPVVVLVGTLATLARGFARPGGSAESGSPASLALALACGLVCLASWLQYFPVSETRHRFWAIAPAIGPFAFFLLKSAQGRVLPVAVALILFAMPLWSDRVAEAARAARAPYQRIAGGSVLAGMYVPASDAPHWQALLAAVGGQVAARPDVPMFCKGTDALFVTLVPNLRNPNPFYFHYGNLPLGLLGQPDFERQYESFIERYNPIVYLSSLQKDQITEYEKIGYHVLLTDETLGYHSGIILLAR